MKDNTVYQGIEKIYKAKADVYGKPDVCFALISKFWSAYLGVTVTVKDVGFMMAQLKMAREKCGRGEIDNFIDAANYIALVGDAESRKKPREEP